MALEELDHKGMKVLWIAHRHELLDKDIINAIGFYRKAAEQGHMYAQITLGLRYSEGKRRQKNYETAANYSRKTVKQVDRKAQEILAITSEKRHQKY